MRPETSYSQYSLLTLSPRLEFLLAFGLDFCLPVYKLNFYKYFLNYEELGQPLKSLTADNFPTVCKRISEIVQKYYHAFKPSKVFRPIFMQFDILLLKDLGRNKDIIITKPDKGRGIVIVNKSQYLDSIK